MERPSISRLAVTMLIAAFMLLAGSALAQDDAVIVRVDDRTETVAGFEARFEIAIRGLVASMGMPMSPDMRAQLEGLKPEYLDQLTNDLVLLNEAESRGITVTDEEIDELVASSIGGIPEDQLDSVLESAGFRDLEHYGVMVGETEQIQRLVDVLFEEMEISDGELETWWADNSEQFANEEQVCAAHILVDELDAAEGLVAELAAGADFAELAAEHSTDPGSGAQGGELGCFGRGMMVGPFEEAAFGAEVGEVVGPVESDFGQHIILVSERIGGGEASLEDFRDQAEIAVANERIGDIIGALLEVAEVETHPELLDTAAAPEMEETEEAQETEEADETE